MSPTTSSSTESSEGRAAPDGTQPGADVHNLETQGAEKRAAGEIDEALQCYQAALDKAVAGHLGLDVVARLRTAVATLFDSAGREDQAVPVYEQAIKDLEALEPPDRVTAGQLRNNLAMIYKHQGRFALSEQHYLGAVEALEGVMGKGSEDVASLYNNLGGLYYAAGFADQAKEVFQEALDMRLNILGPDHPDVAQTHCNLGSVYYELGDNAAAKESFEKCLTILEAHIHIEDEAASYEAVGRDYISMLGAIEEDAKAAAFKEHMEGVLARHRAA